MQGGSTPGSNPLPFLVLYTIKDRKGTPFIYLQLTINSTSFTYLDLCIPSNCCKCALIMKKSQNRNIFSTFSQSWNNNDNDNNNNNNNNSNNWEVAHPQSSSSSTQFLIELEFANVGFWGEGKTGVPAEKPLGARERTNNKLNPHMVLTPEFEPGKWQISLPGKGTSFGRSLPN